MTDSLECDVLPEISNTSLETIHIEENSLADTEYQKFYNRNLNYSLDLKFLKNMDKNQLKNVVESNRHKYIDTDTLANSEDNILLEEPPMSCMSLLSLTDSEYKAENVLTDSEANFSRKMSFDMMRSIQDGEICSKCDKYFEVIREKYDDHMCIFKEALENNVNLEKIEALKKKLEFEIEKLKVEKR
ncbi:PACT_coil_coil domain-containing protein [Caerostris extrusa]|uniref:PACT_coil_coil domain-containing protein n=1 Tax=Caerostris extrusa TaxID=172846 RepID=A0AAV4SIE0_CAEEX|nr:PACT_coil_coil domain-containing protein [Caerostris extrusa]